MLLHKSCKAGDSVMHREQVDGLTIVNDSINASGVLEIMIYVFLYKDSMHESFLLIFKVFILYFAVLYSRA